MLFAATTSVRAARPIGSLDTARRTIANVLGSAIATAWRGATTCAMNCRHALGVSSSPRSAATRTTHRRRPRHRWRGRATTSSAQAVWPWSAVTRDHLVEEERGREALGVVDLDLAAAHSGDIACTVRDCNYKITIATICARGLQSSPACPVHGSCPRPRGDGTPAGRSERHGQERCAVSRPPSRISPGSRYGIADATRPAFAACNFHRAE